MITTVQKEKGKADVIANGPNTARQVPEGDGEKEAGVPKDPNAHDLNDRGGFINGKPATKEQVERSTESTNRH